MSDKKRITSKLYIVLGLAYAVVMVVFANAYFLEEQSCPMIFLFIGIELVLGVFLWTTFNFVDIDYIQDGNSLQCFFHGQPFSIPATRRIRRLPATARWGMIRYAVGMIVFNDESGKRKIKFFIAEEEYLSMIRELHME
jgi:hypothetical protein